MERLNVNISAPNLAAVCIDTTEETGRLYHRYAKEPVVFHQYTELILRLEELCDCLGYPQASLEIRRFGDGDADAPAKTPLEPVVSPEELMEQRGELATFLIHVRWRQFATWQGEALWVEYNRKEFFESELDFLKILDWAGQ